MHGRGGDRTIRRRHMLSVLEPANSSVAASYSDAVIIPDSFSKDGRKICVGDCALFKPPQDSPPFIGIICWLIAGKEESLSLSVNWLYRPADLNLGKGTLLEAAPNEVFYSFHKDEIPAASVLHPCKVAFLSKGVEPPSGISSFVCRRVYDIENKCLWWLTDKDYINEHQEEVDHLLNKTQIEMYGAGGRSPKPLNGPTGAQQLRPGLESIQINTSIKGKKKDRVDQSADPIKRERISRTEDADSGQYRPEHILKSEIAKITDKGGLIDLEGVEKLVKLMQSNSTEKKIDLTCRIMLVDVIAVTDSFDCLGWFVQLRGLLVLDEWLQEAHRGKIVGNSSPKESDKSIEEFLLVLLRALDKLPVNLRALQTCNVGKSVNHLRTHKNPEIQRKARSLVDTWKKRVEAEMNINDAKSGLSRHGSWSSEVSHVGSRRAGGSSEGCVKSSTAQSSACKSPSVKLGSGDAVAKIASSYLGSTKSAMSVISFGGASTKDLNSVTLAGGGSPDLPLSTIKEEKSSSSSQSQNNSQSCSSDHAKTGFSFREDARSSTAGSVSMNKTSGSTSCHRKSSNCLQGSAVSGIQKETSLGKFSSLSRSLASEMVSPTRGLYERAPDVGPVDHGNSQRLIVRLPNTVRSPARSTSGGSSEDPTTSMKTSPSAQSEKLNHPDRKVKGKGDAFRASCTPSINMDLCQGRDGLARSDEGNALSPSAPCDRSRPAEDSGRPTKMSKGSVLSSGVTTKPEKSYDASFSSMNALVESCVKLSEASTTALVEDDIGMNLLASVAAGEMSRSDVSPSGSSGRSPAPGDSCSGNDVKSRYLDEDTAQSKDLPDVKVNDGAMPEQGNSVDLLRVKDEAQHVSMPMPTGMSGDKQLNSSCVDSQRNAYSTNMKSDLKPCQVNDDLVALSSEDAINDVKVEGEGAAQLNACRKSSAVQVRINSPSTSNGNCILSDGGKKVDYANGKIVKSRVLTEAATSAKDDGGANEESPLYSSEEMCREDKSAVAKVSDCGPLTEQKPPNAGNSHSESVGGKNEVTCLASCSTDVCVESKAEKAIDVKARSWSEKQNIELSSSNLDKNGNFGEGKSERKEAFGQCPDGPTSPYEESFTISLQKTEQCLKSNRSKLDGFEVGGTEKCASGLNTSSGPTAGSDVDVKLDFDLNEGFPVDDGCQGELAKSSVPGNLSDVQLPCPLPFPIACMSESFPASITVASPAKGPFFPPENPLRGKGELGWKGSAATSAFRPAEPRKVLDMLPSTGDSPPVENIVTKQGRLPLDIDLNVPDQRVLEDVASQQPAQVKCLVSESLDRRGGLDLDLNRVDESPDVGQFSVGNSCKSECAHLSSTSPLSGGFSNSELNASRNFDLNNGPGPDEGTVEILPRARGNVSFLSPFPGVRMNTSEQGNYSSWFPPSNSYSAIAIPSILPGRGEQSYPIVPAAGSPRILGPTGGSSFGPEFYRGPVLSSSPAVPFPAAAPFQYAGFPFDTNFPVSSNLYSSSSTAYVDSSSGGPLCFPAIPLGPSGVVSSHYPRPYIMNLPSGPGNVGAESRKWVGQSLDLNTGPGGTDVERRDERLSSALRQLPIPGSQGPVDEQIKMYQMAGGMFKRKEPDGGWDGDRTIYKQQPSWQNKLHLLEWSYLNNGCQTRHDSDKSKQWLDYVVKFGMVDWKCIYCSQSIYSLAVDTLLENHCCSGGICIARICSYIEAAAVSFSRVDINL